MSIVTPNDVRQALGMTAEEELGVSDVKRYAHIVSPPENVEIFAWLNGRGNADPSARDIVEAARTHRWRVKALCGAEFIPERNPDAYDACQICMDVAGMHMRNAGE